jgi:hypothetical protein
MQVSLFARKTTDNRDFRVKSGCFAGRIWDVDSDWHDDCSCLSQLENALGNLSRTRTEQPMKMKEPLLVAGFLVVWFLLNRWVLPSMGVRT